MSALATDSIKEENFDMTDFKFVKLKIPNLIPYEFIENVKGREFTPEEFYEYQNEQINNPYNLLYALIDETSLIQGFLWAVRERVPKNKLFVNTFSISKKYWNKGKAMPIVQDFLRRIMKEYGVRKVGWATENSKFFKKHGFKESKTRLMEYTEEC